MIPDPIPVKDAAKIIGIHVTGVTRYCALGRLVAEKFDGRTWVVSRASAESFIANPAGNPEFQARKKTRRKK